MPARTVAERFWAKVDRSGGPAACWPFLGALNKYGYGHFAANGKVLRAHRVAIVLGDPADYIRPGGNIPPRELPEGMYGMHECDVRSCCNNGHLEVGEPSENVKAEFARYRRPADALALRMLERRNGERRESERDNGDRRTA